jgi:hypothetical protein
MSHYAHRTHAHLHSLTSSDANASAILPFELTRVGTQVRLIMMQSKRDTHTHGRDTDARAHRTHISPEWVVAVDVLLVPIREEVVAHGY